MSTVKDNPRIFEYLRQMAEVPKGSDAYRELRDSLFSLLVKLYSSAGREAVAHWAHRGADTCDTESLFQESLLSAIEYFKFEKQTGKFNSYIWLIFNRKMAAHMQFLNMPKRDPKKVISIDSNYFTHDESKQTEEVTTLVATLKTDPGYGDDFGDKLANKVAVQKLIANATPYERRLIESVMSGDYLAESRRNMKTGTSRIKKALKSLRAKYPELRGEL